MSTKALFITGASSGIGAATARLAVAQGWQVGLFARSKDKLDALVGELGHKAMALPGDVTDLNSLKTAMATFVGKTGGLNAAFANAGMGLSASGTEAGDPEEWEQMIGVNVLGVLWTVMAAMPHLNPKNHFLKLLQDLLQLLEFLLDLRAKLPFLRQIL
jgi:NADP-dependent 3-hydroxy acid dehydrogenase YdfG